MSGLINSAGSRSGVIDTTELDYEEGTWTPKQDSGGTVFGGSAVGKLLKSELWSTCGLMYLTGIVTIRTFIIYRINQIVVHQQVVVI